MNQPNQNFNKGGGNTLRIRRGARQTYRMNSVQILALAQNTFFGPPKISLRAAYRWLRWNWSSVSRHWKGSGNYYPRQGERECARRVKQMANGANCGQHNFTRSDT